MYGGVGFEPTIFMSSGTIKFDDLQADRNSGSAAKSGASAKAGGPNAVASTAPARAWDRMNGCPEGNSRT